MVVCCWCCSGGSDEAESDDELFPKSVDDVILYILGSQLISSISTSSSYADLLCALRIRWAVLRLTTDVVPMTRPE